MPHVRPLEPHRAPLLIEPAGERGMADLDPTAIIEFYKAHGALLFRGFGANLDRFRCFAQQFCATSVFNESPGRRVIDAAHNIHTVDGGNGAFALHPEVSREPWKPDAAFFACLAPPDAGGATTICDGVELVRAMPEAVRRGLARRRLVYLRRAWPSELRYWLGDELPGDEQLAAPPPTCPYHFWRLADGRIVRAFSRPALHRPMFSNELAFGNFLLFSHFNLGVRDFPVLDDGRPVGDDWMMAIRETGDRLTIAVEWQAGDLLMLDNTRFMHGRTAFPAGSERLVASYFGYLNFARHDAEGPADPPWRRHDFRPPVIPELAAQPDAAPARVAA